jgi:heptosyltransferase-1
LSGSIWRCTKSCFKAAGDNRKPVDPVSSILIIRPSAIGDVVMASPMIKVLREGNPEARLVWLAEPQVRDLLCANPQLDQVIIWPKGKWRDLFRRGRLIALVREIRCLARTLRRENFDLALDVQGLLRSRLLAWLSGARERVGFESREPGRFLLTRVVPRGSDKRMSSEYFRLMESLDLQPGAFRPEVIVSGPNREEAARILREAGLAGKFAVICPFTTRPQKHWFEERWAALALEIEARFGLPVILLGGPGDAEGSRRIQTLTGGRIHDFAGRTSLGQTAAIIESCALLVGVDTGLTHMGTAFARPTAALFGATCPYLSTASPLTRVLYDRHSCSPCRRNPTCEGEFQCMKAITVEKVVEVAGELLTQSEPRG